MSKFLLRNTITYFLTNLISQAAVFVLWVFIAKVLSPSEVGIYALAIFIIDFFGAIAIFGLDSTITRFYHSEEKKESVFVNSLIIFILSSIVSLAVFVLVRGTIIKIIPGISTALSENVFLFCELIFFYSIYNFSLFHYSALKNVFNYFKVSIIQTIIFFFGAIFLVRYIGVVGLFYALFFSYLFSSSFFLLKEAKNLSFSLFNKKVVRSIISYSLPMMAYSVFGVFAVYTGRIFLDKYASLSTLGIYSFFLAITLQINGGWATFNRSWTPEVFSEFKNASTVALEKVKKMAFLSTFLYLNFLACIILLKMFGVLNIFLNMEYVENIKIFYILLLGPLFTGVYTACYPLYYYEKKTNLVLIISFILNLFNMALAFLMIKYFDQIGAALSYFLVSLVTAFAFILSFKKIMKIPVQIVIWLLILSVMIVTGMSLYIITNRELILLFFVILSSVLAYKLGKLSIKNLFLNV